MKTHLLTRLLSIFAIAGAVLFFAGCSTPAGKSAQSGQKEADRVVDGVNSANSTVNKTADTAESVSKTARRLFK